MVERPSATDTRPMHAAELLAALREQGFTAPTQIQAQSWPAIVSGRDIIGIAETGSGKTLAYAIPALLHAKKVRAAEGNSGSEASRSSGAPSVLILAPTRELALQIEHALNPFCHALDLSQVCTVLFLPCCPPTYMDVDVEKYHFSRTVVGMLVMNSWFGLLLVQFALTKRFQS